MTEIVAATKVHQSWPEWLMELRQQAKDDFPEDIEKAVAWLLEQVEAHEGAEEVKTSLVHFALRALHYQDRHHYNTGVKEKTFRDKQYSNEPRADYGRATNKFFIRHREILALRIGGKVLSSLVIGEEVANLARKERACANGHLFHAAFLEWCNANGRDGETIASIPSHKLVKAWTRLQAEYGIKLGTEGENMG